jgi:diguanylate cyclase (GGDEF)-like protein
VVSERQLSVVLSEFALTMVNDFPIQGILERLVGRIVEMLPVTGAGVTLISPFTNPRYVAASDAAALRFEQLQTDLGEGPCLAAYRTGEAVSVPDLSNDVRFERFTPRAVELGLRAAFTFPLRQRTRRLGALDLYRTSPGALSEPDMKAAQTLADVTSAYLVNAQQHADLRDASDRSYESSVHDPLTGLPNRVLLVERLGHALQRGRRTQKMVAALFVDLDGFKAVNDRFGHQFGDNLLIGVAQRLSSLLRPGDTVARISGDEFVILCEDVDNGADAELIAARIFDALVPPFDLPGARVDISASVGISLARGGEESPAQLLEDADAAMYEAKRKGGARHQLINLHDQARLASRASIRHDIGGALARGEFRLEYQPIVRTGDGRLVGVEALLRWDHPTRGPIAPAVAVPIAEQTGLINEIGRWVLERACADRQRWALSDDCSIAVNVSSHQLIASDFASTVAEVLASTGTPPEALFLEITESVFIHDTNRALVVLDELKQAGVSLSLDDFGTGHSSLHYLHRFPIDIVKIAPELVSKVTVDPATRAVVGKVIELARLLDLAVIAEGVETAEELREIVALGAERCQGFYLARPMTSSALSLRMGQTEPPYFAGPKLDGRLR